MAELISGLLNTLIESSSLPGARIPARLATWTEKAPELKLNLVLLAEAFLQLLASGIGTVALVWATVVLLGGFSTMLARIDFWFTTAIVFVETARIVGYNSAPEAKFFVDVLSVFSKKNIMRVGHTTNFVRLIAMGPTWIALAPIFVATACMSLSMIRIVGIARHPYKGSSTDGSNDNLMPALILFYALVLIQGILFVLWYVVAVNRSISAKGISSGYLGIDGRRWRLFFPADRRNESITLIDRYVDSIADTCIEKGVSATVNSNLVSFAAEFLQSEHPDEIIYAVLVIFRLVVVNEERSCGAIEQICSSEKFVYSLLRFLRSDHLRPVEKAYMAEIVATLAHKMRLADIPDAAQCIACLLNPTFMKCTSQIGRNGGNIFIDVTILERNQRILERDQRMVDIYNRPQEKPLFVYGLQILDELAVDPENCREICKTTDLVPKIIAPVSSALHVAIKNDAAAAKIVRVSLRVVDKLTRGTGESSTSLCCELVERYGRTAKNILWILSNSSDPEMRMLAFEILSRLPLDAPRMLEFVTKLKLLFDPEDSLVSPLRIKAGKALAGLVRSQRVTVQKTSHRVEFADEFSDIQRLLTIISAQAEYSKEYRAVTAEILAQICAKSRTDEDRDRLRSVASVLTTVLKAIVTETINITNSDTRKFLASFLGLVVQIGERLASAEEFVTELTRENINYAEKLKGIIEEIYCVVQEKENIDNIWYRAMQQGSTEDINRAVQQKEIFEATYGIEDEVWLAIMKAATKLVTRMLRIHVSPSYVQFFREANLVDKLHAFVKAMADMERRVGMATVDDDEIERYETLQTLVETAAKEILAPSSQ